MGEEEGRGGERRRGEERGGEERRGEEEEKNIKKKITGWRKRG